MSISILSAPIKDKVIDDRGFANKSWIFYFNQLADGDPGSEWTPISANLTGGFALTGKYFRNSGFIDFWITVDPTTTSSSVFGTTYIDLPFDVTVACPCFVVYGSTIAQGIIDPSVNRLFPPTWTSVASTVTITARVFIK